MSRHLTPTSNDGPRLLREAIEAHGLTRSEMARALGVAPSAVTVWCRPDSPGPPKPVLALISLSLSIPAVGRWLIATSGVSRAKRRANRARRPQCLLDARKAYQEPTDTQNG